MKKGSFIVSLGHKTEINGFCRDLKEKTALDYFVAYLLFNNGQKFIISNIFHVLETYYYEGYYLKDYSSTAEIISDKDHYICDQIDSVSPDFSEILEDRFNVYRLFHTIRRSQECIFVFGAASKIKIPDKIGFFNKIKYSFDEFCYLFISRAIKLIKDYNPQYRSALILNDDIYLKKIILQRSQVSPILTSREKECLIWAAEGKTAEETAIILNISKETIQKHRRSIIQKLDCPNLCNAVYKAITEGSMGNLANYDYLVNMQLIKNPTVNLRNYNNVLSSPPPS